MKIILDEGVPRRLARALEHVDRVVVAFPDEWKGLSDREVLDRAETDGFSILVTNDKNMPFQQPLAARRLAVLILPDTDRHVVFRRVDEIATACSALQAGRYHVLGRSEPLPTDPRKPL